MELGTSNVPKIGLLIWWQTLQLRHQRRLIHITAHLDLVHVTKCQLGIDNSSVTNELYKNWEVGAWSPTFFNAPF